MNMAWLLWGVVFGSVGVGYFMYGKKQARPLTLVCGLALMIYPYFIGNVWAVVGIGLGLMALPWLARR